MNTLYLFSSGVKMMDWCLEVCGGEGRGTGEIPTRTEGEERDSDAKICVMLNWPRRKKWHFIEASASTFRFATTIHLAVIDFGARCTIAYTTHNDVVGVHFFGYNILIDMKIIYYSLLLYHLDVYCLKMDKLRKLR